MRRRRTICTAFSLFALCAASGTTAFAQRGVAFAPEPTPDPPTISIAVSAPKPAAAPPRIVYGGSPLPLLRVDSAVYRDPADNEICVAPENLAPLGVIFMVDEKAGKVSLSAGDGMASVTVDVRTPPEGMGASRGVFVPAMEVIEGLGGKCQWDAATNTLQARAVLTAVERDGDDIKIKATLPILPIVRRNETGKVLMIDVPGAEIGAIAKIIPSDDPRIAQIRTGQFESDTARVVVEMRAASSLAILSEKPALEIAFRPLMDRTDTKSSPTVAVAKKPSSSAPVQVRAVTFRRVSDSRAQFLISSSAVPLFRAALDGAKLTLNLLNATLGPNAEVPLKAVSHPFVKAVQLLVGDNKAATLTLDLTRVVNYSVKPDAKGNILLDIGLPRGAGGRLAGKTIVVDPGHGGRDPGAGGANGAREKDITLGIGLKLADALRDAGANVIMTRADDFFLEVNDRPRIANRVNADFFVSIHADSTDGGSSLSGATIYFHSDDDDCRTLGKCISTRMTQTTGMKSRGARTDYIRYPGIGYGVLRNAQMPAVLCETGFMTNPGDLARLRNPESQQRIAEAIRAGLRDYIEGFSVTDAHREKAAPPRTAAPAATESNDDSPAADGNE